MPDFRAHQCRSSKTKHPLGPPALFLYPTTVPSRSDVGKSSNRAPPSPRTPPASRYPRWNSSRELISPPLTFRTSAVSQPSPTSFLFPSDRPKIKFETIGDPSLRIYKLRLPAELIERLDSIVFHSEHHASYLPGGWSTYLFSLTKQDMALRAIPGMSIHILPIMEYILQSIRIVYGCRRVVIDKNQPHILKYSVQSGHTGGESE